MIAQPGRSDYRGQARVPVPLRGTSIYEPFARDRRDRRFARVPEAFERFLRAGRVALERIWLISFRFTLATSGGSFDI
jgi:hypothetical protein